MEDNSIAGDNYSTGRYLPAALTKYLLNVLIMSALLSNSFGQSFNWKNAVPEEIGFSTEKLNAMKDTLALHSTTSILVIKDDKIILEWYAPGWDQCKMHYTASLAKALVGGMSLALALDDNRLQVDDLAQEYIPEWKNDPLKSLITIRHLATHSSGIEDAQEWAETGDTLQGQKYIRKYSVNKLDIQGWKSDFWRRNPDPFSISRDKAPVLFEPGTYYHYSNPGMAMLAYAVTSSYTGTQYRDIRTLLKERIMNPIGISDNEWQIGYGETNKVNGLELVANWGGGNFTPRAVARIGRLMLNRGKWDNKQLISSSWAERVVEYAGTPIPPRDGKDLAPACGLAWYNNYDGVWTRAPRDLFLGAGAGNQTLIVIPGLNIIVVRNGENMYDAEKGEGSNYGVVNYIINPLMDAYNEPPYPMSRIIKEVKFAPESEIVRKASGSDNWPITWGNDDNQYTAYGDGWGFEPKVEKKLSLGLSKIIGNPDDFQGINIRSESGEFIGQGRFGKKASGMLMVDGILYLWVRNADEDGKESQLAWSNDYGKSWTFSEWKFTSGFGYPTFLNFGKDYQDANDNYIYIYSHNDIDAYKPADQMVLARVEKKRIMDLNRYEYFEKIDKEGNPVWSKEINKRGAVFIHPAKCYRGGITYNAGLKRYLWCQIHPYSKHPQGSRFQGGFGIYEAAEPWGPWHTVYYTNNWDVGPGETMSFPSKWMSEDGRTCYLLFSGDDCFSLRRVDFVTE